MGTILRELPLLLALGGCGADAEPVEEDPPDPAPDLGCSDTGSFAWWPDEDRDGYGDLDRPHEEGWCLDDVPEGWVMSRYWYCQDGDDFPPGYDTCDERWGDCDDTDPAVHPEAEEPWYDGLDGDCDGESDYDADRDGYDAETYGGEDCSDDDDQAHPLSAERCDGDDDDCDGAVDGPRCGSARDFAEVDVVLQTSVTWLQERALINVGDTDGVGDRWVGDEETWLGSALTAGDFDGDGAGDLVFGTTNSEAAAWFLRGG